MQKRNLAIVLTILLLLALAIAAWRYYSIPSEQSSETAAAIQNEVEGLQISDINKEFDSIDKELQSL